MAEPSQSGRPASASLRTPCFPGWPWVLLGLGPCFPPQADLPHCGGSGPVPFGGALTCGLSVLCVLEPWPPDHQNVLKDLGSLAGLSVLAQLQPPTRALARHLHTEAVVVPGCGCCRTLSATETQTGQPCLLRWEVLTGPNEAAVPNLLSAGKGH